jgi:hypothetical protein
MNKNLGFIILCLILTISCKKEATNTNSITLSQNSDWTTLEFKNNYTIQFPADYFGEGRIGFEGNIFRKEKNDSSVVFSYDYCSPLFCQDFGDTLFQSFPNSINIKINDITITLNQESIFHDSSSSQTAILYYNDKDNAHARLYWKDNGMYKQVLEVAFNYSRLQEVLDIIKTIKEK